MRFGYVLTIFGWVLAGCGGARVNRQDVQALSSPPAQDPVATQPSAGTSAVGDPGHLQSEKMYFQTRSLVTLRFGGVPLLYGEQFFLVNQGTKAILGTGTVESSNPSLWLEAPDSHDESVVRQGWSLADPAEEFQGYGLVDGKAVSVSLLPTERRLAGKLIYGRNQLSLLSVQESGRPITDTVRVVLRDFPFASLGTARFEGDRLGQRAGGYQGRLGWFSHMHARAKDTVLNSGVMQILHK